MTEPNHKPRDPLEPRPRVDEPLTPEIEYIARQAGDRFLQIDILFPFDITHWAGGTSQLTEEMSKLEMYEGRAAERDRIMTLIEKTLVPVAADAYKVLRGVDKRIGTHHVRNGIDRAKRQRLRRDKERAFRRGLIKDLLKDQ